VDECGGVPAARKNKQAASINTAMKEGDCGRGLNITLLQVHETTGKELIDGLTDQHVVKILTTRLREQSLVTFRIDTMLQSAGSFSALAKFP
jgi:hypothetical protein